MDIKYIDESNNAVPFEMGCYGIGVSRVLGAIYENNTIKENDQVVGYSLPLSVTPYYAYIVYNDKRSEDAIKLYNDLISNNIKVILDDTNAGLGEKIRNAKVLGIPYVVILGNNSECEIEKIKDNSKLDVTLETARNKIIELQQTKKDIF